MKKTLLILHMLLNIYVNGQEGFLTIINLETQKERGIKENKRIRISTVNGEKFQGRFRIINENTIALDGITITLEEIEIIRRHPLFNTIFIKANLIHIGSLGLFFGVLGTGLSNGLSDGQDTYAPLAGGVVLLAAGVYGAIKSPNLNKGYRIDKKWKFTLNIPDDERIYDQEKLPDPYF